MSFTESVLLKVFAILDLTEDTDHWGFTSSDERANLIQFYGHEGMITICDHTNEQASAVCSPIDRLKSFEVKTRRFD